MLQDVIDALSFELPKVIPKFADLSSRCLELVEEIVDRFVVACNPRDMLSMLCEVLDLELDSDQTLVKAVNKLLLSYLVFGIEDNKVLVIVEYLVNVMTLLI